MLTPIVLVTVLMVTTCVIAYWSDNLGKNLGKKRITLFNLRPRQTATLITMVSSVGIMLLTLAGLLLVNRSLRHALFRYDAQVHENNRLKEENESQSKSLERTRRQTEQAKQDKEGAERERLVAEKDKRKAESDRLLAANGRAKAQEDLKQAKTDLGTAQNDLRQAQSERRTAKASQRDAEGKATEAEGRFQSAQVRYNQAQARYNQAQTQLEQVEGQLASAKTRLASAQTRLASAQTRLASAQERTKEAEEKERRATRVAQVTTRVSQQAVKNLQASTQQVVDAEEKLKTLRRDLADTQDDLDSARQARSQAETAAIQATNRTVGFQAGAVIATPDSVLAALTIPADQSREQLEAALQSALRAGSDVARRLGTSDQPVRGVTLEEISLINSDNKPTYTLASDQIIPALAQHLENSPTPVAVVLVPTRFHALGDDSIKSRFIYSPVRTAFAKGERIASIEVNPGQSDARLFAALQVLSEQGKVAALKQGLSPLLTSQGGFYVEGTYDRAFDALHSIQDWSKAHPQAKSVTVNLVADANLNTADPMRVRFEVASS